MHITEIDFEVLSVQFLYVFVYFLAYPNPDERCDELSNSCGKHTKSKCSIPVKKS